MIFFLFITALTVSIDAFICGFSLTVNPKNKFYAVSIISLTVFVMCLFTNYFALFFLGFITEKVANLAGIILIIIGGYNLICEFKEKKADDKTLYCHYFLTGIAVGLDGAFANLSLSIMGINAFYVPIVIALFHFISVSLGLAVKNCNFVCKVNKFKYIPPLLLILLGLYKTVCFFI